MHLKKFLAGLAILCVTGVVRAQSCGDKHAHANMSSNEGMATVTRTLHLNADQQATFSKALDACAKDCATVQGEEADAKAKRNARFDAALTSMRASLDADQAKKFDAMKEKGELNMLCGDGSKAGCGKASAGKSCCAGKAHAAASDKPAQSLQPAPEKSKN
jgi:hypothetical protein